MCDSGSGLPFSGDLSGTSTGRTAVRTAPCSSIGTGDNCSQTQTQALVLPVPLVPLVPLVPPVPLVPLVPLVPPEPLVPLVPLGPLANLVPLAPLVQYSASLGPVSQVLDEGFVNMGVMFHHMARLVMTRLQVRQTRKHLMWLEQYALQAPPLNPQGAGPQGARGGPQGTTGSCGTRGHQGWGLSRMGGLGVLHRVPGVLHR